MKKINITLVILLALALVFTGCRGEGGEDTTAPPTETTSPVTTAEETTSVSETTECTHPDMITREIVPNCTEIYNIESYCHFCGYTKHEPQPPYGHRFVNNTCTICGISGEPEASEGLEFRTFADYAVVVGIGTCKDSEVIIPATYNGLPVTEIWDRAFYQVKNMTSVTIPEGVTYIESEAFLNCPALEIIKIAEGNEKYFAKNNCLIEKNTGKLVLGGGKAEIPADGSVKSIGAHAFTGNLLLESINIPDGVTDIHTSAFEGCVNLRTLTLPKSLKTIRQSAFKGCISLESLILPDSVTEIYNGAFSGCRRLKDITLSKNLTLIDSEAFKGCAIESIEIPAGVKELGAAFAECEKLKSVTLPEGFDRFVGHTFAGCTSLESIDLPASLKYIGMYTFKDCTALKKLRFGGSVAEWKWVATQDKWNNGAAFKYVKCSDGEADILEITEAEALEKAAEYWRIMYGIKDGDHTPDSPASTKYKIVVTGLPSESSPYYKAELQAVGIYTKLLDELNIDAKTGDIILHADASDRFYDILRGFEAKFFNISGGYLAGNEVTLDEYCDAVWGKRELLYTELDIDGDGVTELVINDTALNIATLVLHEENGVMYGFTFTEKAFDRLKTDGTFIYEAYPESGNKYEYYAAKLKFSGSECKTEKLFGIYVDSSDAYHYYNGNKSITKDDVDALWDTQNAKDSPDWSPLGRWYLKKDNTP